MRESLAILWRGRWLFLASVILVPAAVFSLSRSFTKTYEASSTVQIRSTLDPTFFGGQPAEEKTVDVAARLIKTTAIAGQVARSLPPPRPTARDLIAKIRVEPDPKVSFLTIVASDSSPRRAALIANAYSRAVVGERAKAATAELNIAINQLRAQLSSLPRGATSERTELTSQLQRLRALRKEGATSSAGIVEPAFTPRAPVSPKPVRNTALAVVIAILLGLGLVALRHRLDRRVHTPSELEGLLGAPLLALVPETAFKAKKLADAREAFHTLRASLMYFNVDREIKSVVVTSAAKGEGKTTVATNLALAAAEAGRDVILVDADLRRPQVGARLGVRAAGGLAHVLTGQRDLEETLEVLEVGSSRLRVLTAGATPPNPSELLASQRMRGLIDRLSDEADLVVIDSTPVLAVSDVFPLVEYATGTVLVGRLNRTTRDEVTRLSKVVSTMKGTVLGVVATGHPSRSAYGYAYGYGKGYESGSDGDGASQWPVSSSSE
ncbi:MAG: polysaccharide biosynthesis tyrosine autokinase, partial [Actinomycetota bacterium]|nr:polysaccharide biosynthesis tyrosine autokinase [Actinomycetota bacterium]